MKGLLLLAVFAASAVGQTAAVHSVYILPMAGGLDQYLAEQLTRDGAMHVTVDPKTADAVLTDRLGEAFEKTMARICPRDDDDEEDDSTTAHRAFRSAASKGTVFLVDAKSRRVLWSDFEKSPRSSGAPALNREAGHIVKKLRESRPKETSTMK